jgi:hypothetical protein
MRALIAALVFTTATPAFADQLWDTCHKLAQDRVGPINQSHRRHYEGFVVQCLKGQIPLRATTAASGPPGHVPLYTDDGRDLAAETHRDIRCVKSPVNGQQYCY